jgi:hypothetical protein
MIELRRRERYGAEENSLSWLTERCICKFRVLTRGFGFGIYVLNLDSIWIKSLLSDNIVELLSRTSSSQNAVPLLSSPRVAIILTCSCIILPNPPVMR